MDGMLKTLLGSLVVAALALPAQADDEGVEVMMRAVDRSGTGPGVGHVTITETEYGTLFTPRLYGIPPGIRGFHVHEHGSCEPSRDGDRSTPAGAAGGHYDPDGTGKHGAPWGDGHRGDLPALYVAADGTATYPVLAPRLTLDEIRGRALMIHAGADNHADHPEPLGGGGPRLFCGVIPE